MSKTRITLTIDADVLLAVRRSAAATGRSVSEVVEESLRRELGREDLGAVWANVEPLPESEAMTLALAAQRDARRKNR